MDASHFAEFWERQGYRVIRTSSCYWFNSQPFSFISIPYHRVVAPSAGELARVLMQGPAAAVRFPCAWQGPARQGGLVVRPQGHYDLSSLSKKARNQTRRGLATCAVTQIGFRELALRGYPLNVDTWQRQGRNPQTFTPLAWQRYCLAARAVPGFEAWAAFANGRLAAFLVAALVEDVFTILHQGSLTALLPCYPNNALVFHVTKAKLERTQARWVSYGLRGLTDTGTLERFKFAMGFSLFPFDDRVIVNPVLKPLLDWGGRHWIERCRRKRPDRDFWSKASKALALAD